MELKKPYVIAEIGCNHKGDIEIAKELIKMAKIFCNVDAVKLQKRNRFNFNSIKELIAVFGICFSFAANSDNDSC